MDPMEAVSSSPVDVVPVESKPVEVISSPINVTSPLSSYVPKNQVIRRRCNEKGQQIFISDRPVFRCKDCKLVFQVDNFNDESDMIEAMEEHTLLTTITKYKCKKYPPGW